MPASKRTPWIVRYDITDPRRLVRVHRKLKRHGIPVQYSVFFLQSTRRALTALLATVVVPLIDPRSDDLRAYPLFSGAAPAVFGRGSVPDGISFLNKWDELLRPRDPYSKAAD